MQNSAGVSLRYTCAWLIRATVRSVEAENSFAQKMVQEKVEFRTGCALLCGRPREWQDNLSYDVEGQHAFITRHRGTDEMMQFLS